MATAEMKTVIVPKPVELKRIVLELTVAEARAIATVCERIGGSPETTLRGQVDKVYRALRAAGAQVYESDNDMGLVHVGGGASLYFNDGSVSYIRPGEDE